MPCCRCSRCGARRTLAKHPDEYVLMPSCRTPGCAGKTHREGRRQSWRVDKWRHRHEVGAGAPKPCRCCGGFYHFPHRRGSRWCEHAAWTTEDAEANFGVKPVEDDSWWRNDPLSFGQRPTTSAEPPF